MVVVLGDVTRGRVMESVVCAGMIVGVSVGILTQPRQNCHCFHRSVGSAGLVSFWTPIFPTQARQDRSLAINGDGFAGVVSFMTISSEVSSAHVL